MSYCVKCGVELDDSAKKCALCGTLVYFPGADKSDETEKPFSDIKAVPRDIKEKLAAVIITVLLLIPGIICGIVNLFLHESGYWSLYVIWSLVLAWIIFVFPFIPKKQHPYMMWGFDTAAVLLYMYAVFTLYGQKTDLFKFIILPVLLAISACVFVFISWARKRSRHWSSVMIHILTDIILICAVIGLATYINGYIVFAVTALIIALSSLSLMVFAIYCNRSLKMRNWLKKKLFV